MSAHSWAPAPGPHLLLLPSEQGPTSCYFLLTGLFPKERIMPCHLDHMQAHYLRMMPLYPFAQLFQSVLAQQTVTTLSTFNTSVPGAS